MTRLNDADHNYSWRNTMLPRYMKRGGRELAGECVGACTTPVASARLGGIRSWLASVFFNLFFALEHTQLTNELLRRIALRGIPFFSSLFDSMLRSCAPFALLELKLRSRVAKGNNL